MCIITVMSYTFHFHWLLHYISVQNEKIEQVLLLIQVLLNVD